MRHSAGNRAWCGFRRLPRGPHRLARRQCLHFGSHFCGVRNPLLLATPLRGPRQSLLDGSHVWISGHWRAIDRVKRGVPGHRRSSRLARLQQCRLRGPEACRYARQLWNRRGCCVLPRCQIPAVRYRDETTRHREFLQSPRRRPPESELRSACPSFRHPARFFPRARF